jgi:hypothetical protein
MNRPDQARLADEAVGAYADWREECVTLSDAYERWARASRADSRSALAGSWAAVDREQRTAHVYGDLMMRLAASVPAAPTSPMAPASAQMTTTESDLLACMRAERPRHSCMPRCIVWATLATPIVTAAAATPSPG